MTKDSSDNYLLLPETNFNKKLVALVNEFTEELNPNSIVDLQRTVNRLQKDLDEQQEINRELREERMEDLCKTINALIIDEIRGILVAFSTMFYSSLKGQNLIKDQTLREIQQMEDKLYGILDTQMNLIHDKYVTKVNS